MIQLLQKNINTLSYTNSFLRNVEINENISILSLREDGINTENFVKLDIFKNLCLDLARQVNAEFIKDICIIVVPSGQLANIEKSENRLILALENCSSFETDEKRFTPDTGDLIWLNEKITISNTNTNYTILLIIDTKEFLL